MTPEADMFMICVFKNAHPPTHPPTQTCQLCTGDMFAICDSVVRMFAWGRPSWTFSKDFRAEKKRTALVVHFVPSPLGDE